MKTSIWIVAVVLVVGIFPVFPTKVLAESSTISATISIIVLPAPNAKIEQCPEAKACLESQLKKNPLSTPEIKVKETAQNSQSPASQKIIYSIYEKP